MGFVVMTDQTEAQWAGPPIDPALGPPLDPALRAIEEPGSSGGDWDPAVGALECRPQADPWLSRLLERLADHPRDARARVSFCVEALQELARLRPEGTVASDRDHPVVCIFCQIFQSWSKMAEELPKAVLWDVHVNLLTQVWVRVRGLWERVAVFCASHTHGAPESPVPPSDESPLALTVADPWLSAHVGFGAASERLGALRRDKKTCFPRDEAILPFGDSIHGRQGRRHVV
jgi:hypothetical protein